MEDPSGTLVFATIFSSHVNFDDALSAEVGDLVKVYMKINVPAGDTAERNTEIQNMEDMIFSEPVLTGKLIDLIKEPAEPQTQPTPEAEDRTDSDSDREPLRKKYVILLLYLYNYINMVCGYALASHAPRAGWLTVKGRTLTIIVVLVVGSCPTIEKKLDLLVELSGEPASLVKLVHCTLSILTAEHQTMYKS